MKNYIKYIILIIIQILCFNALLFSQDIRTALIDYDRGRLENVRNTLIILKDTDYAKPEYLFLTAVFEQDAELAFEQYEMLSTIVAQDPLFERILWKMCQYYFAKELYETCSESIERFLSAFPQSGYRESAVRIKERASNYLGRELNVPINPPVEQTVVIYTLQLGVFGIESNARRQLSNFQQLGLQKAYIKEHRVGSQVLYKIWFGEFSDKQSAQMMRDELQQKYKLGDIFITEKK